MGPAALAFCLALGSPADTPGYTYQARQSEINICVNQALVAWEAEPTRKNSETLGQILDVQASCLSYCPPKWSVHD